MNTSGDAAESIVRMSLQALEVAVKLSGSGAKNVAAIMIAMLKDQKQTKGKTRLTNMLKSGKELKVFTVKEEDLRKFTEEAKRYGVLTIRRQPYKKNIRVPNYGDDYTEEKIIERIKVEKITRVPFLNEFSKNKYYRSYDYKREKPKGIYALYLHYCYLLNVIPKSKPYKKIPATLREDSRKLDQISNETKLLVSENLITDEQFFLFKENKQKELNNLLEEREKLYYEFSNKTNKDEMNDRLDEIKPKIKELRRVIKLCDGIEERIPRIERNTQEFIDCERKESERSEHIK